MLDDLLATGTWVGIGSGAALAGGAWYMGLIGGDTLLNLLLLTALVIFFYWVWTQLSTALCKTPILGGLFCRERTVSPKPTGDFAPMASKKKKRRPGT